VGCVEDDADRPDDSTGGRTPCTSDSDCAPGTEMCFRTSGTPGEFLQGECGSVSEDSEFGTVWLAISGARALIDAPLFSNQQSWDDEDCAFCGGQLFYEGDGPLPDLQVRVIFSPNPTQNFKSAVFGETSDVSFDTYLLPISGSAKVDGFGIELVDVDSDDENRYQQVGVACQEAWPPQHQYWAGWSAVLDEARNGFPSWRDTYDWDNFCNSFKRPPTGQILYGFVR
jgi:hypothetical protein